MRWVLFLTAALLTGNPQFDQRIRWDLIEAFKVTIASGLTDYGSEMFRISRSGLDHGSRNRCSRNSTKIKNVQKSFLSE